MCCIFPLSALKALKFNRKWLNFSLKAFEKNGMIFLKKESEKRSELARLFLPSFPEMMNFQQLPAGNKRAATPQTDRGAWPPSARSAPAPLPPNRPNQFWPRLDLESIARKAQQHIKSLTSLDQAESCCSRALSARGGLV